MRLFCYNNNMFSKETPLPFHQQKKKLSKVELWEENPTFQSFLSNKKAHNKSYRLKDKHVVSTENGRIVFSCSWAVFPVIKEMINVGCLSGFKLKAILRIQKKLSSITASQQKKSGKWTLCWLVKSNYVWGKSLVGKFPTTKIQM